MKNLIVMLFASLIIVNASCTKDKVTRVEAYFTNNTHSTIRVLPYKSGIVKGSDTIRIGVGDTIQIAGGSEYGDVKVPHFASEILAIEKNDSIKVIFDDLYSVFHYVDTSGITPAEKYYLFEENRNILNRANYSFVMVRDGRMLNLHYYTFTEADYEFAKKP